MSAGIKLRVALLGSRGIPACYGGYETLMEELSRRLVERGHEVTVYCRSHYTDATLQSHGGARLVVLPTVRTKHLDTPVHTLLSVLHAAFQRFDVALVVNGANALFVPILRMARVPTALHVDGLEQRRAKWGALGRSVYRWSERWAGLVATRVVTDAEVIRRHYQQRYQVESTMIPYGVTVREPSATDWLQRLGLEPRRYFLYVSRFEPENNPHRVAAAYAGVSGDLPLVMVGDAPYLDPAIEKMRRSSDERVVFPGAIYGDGYHQLMANARGYIHATEVGGTHPALVEAMGYDNCVLVHETPENREVAGGAGVYFDVHQPESLGRRLEELVVDPARARRLGQSAGSRARERFSWTVVADAYEGLLGELARQRRS